jgi:hypothetical protein
MDVQRTGSASGVEGVMLAGMLGQGDDLIVAELDNKVADFDAGRTVRQGG